MARVYTLYRVSTVGQVDHDDIPMQRIACREFAQAQAGWEIVKELYEKGVSGYKVKTENRDAIMEIKADALAGKFDILLVFMFDRLGRRDDETPFVVQWFVSHGIRVWSVKEGEQRFDSHVDKLLNYIRFWQASGESEKTAIRVRAKQQQMVLAGEYRGGLVPFGFDAVYLGRVNKKNRPVRDLVRNEEEAAIKAEVYHKIVDEGYGGNRIANWLNERGVKTKRGTTLWRATSVRAMIGNPIDRGQMHLGDTLSEPIEALRIVDDYYFYKAIEIISRSLRGAVANTPEGRADMALGQYVAGMGFSNVGLGIAHSMAHTLGAVYDTPHGVACAMMLPIVMEYNQECTGEKYREIARAMGVKDVDSMTQEEYRKAAIDAVRKLSVDVGIPTKLEAIKEEDLQFLAESAHADACAPGNPKDASVEDLKDLFRKIM